jgi:hypothetical protein
LYHKRYSFTVILPNITEGDPKLLHLKHYRAAADGWKDSTGCALCVSEYRSVTSHLTSCELPRACVCKVCLRQPPK